MNTELLDLIRWFHDTHPEAWPKTLGMWSITDEIEGGGPPISRTDWTIDPVGYVPEYVALALVESTVMDWMAQYGVSVTAKPHKREWIVDTAHSTESWTAPTRLESLLLAAKEMNHA